MRRHLFQGIWKEMCSGSGEKGKGHSEQLIRLSENGGGGGSGVALQMRNGKSTWIQPRVVGKKWVTAIGNGDNGLKWKMMEIGAR